MAGQILNKGQANRLNLLKEGWMRRYRLCNYKSVFLSLIKCLKKTLTIKLQAAREELETMNNQLSLNMNNITPV